jgi:glucose/arabinose dehydrogenase
MISAGNRAFSFSLAAASATAALFLTTARGAAAPPDGVAQAPDGSLYIAESVKGKIWRVLYTGK